MDLTLEQIRNAALGAVEVVEEQGLVCLHRFTPEQRALYRAVEEGFYIKALGTAGIKLRFRTDSKQLSVKIHTQEGSSRNYFALEVHADGMPVGMLNNFEKRQLGEFSGAFSLGEGEKTVTVYLPWSVCTRIERLCLDDGAAFIPVRPKKKLLMYGDSITQGCDARQPSNRYGAKLAEFLGAEEYNKGICNDQFFPQLAQTDEPFTPDFITVAYGTNDWNKRNEQEFKDNCSRFLHTVFQKNPQAEIFVITPIWRKDCQEKKNGWPFHRVEQIIRDICQDYSNVTVLRGFDFVPKDEAYYYDLRLHPNDEGFAHYAENLCSAIADARK